MSISSGAANVKIIAVVANVSMAANSSVSKAYRKQWRQWQYQCQLMAINENGMAAMKWLERSNNNRNIMAKISMAWHRCANGGNGGIMKWHQSMAANNGWRHGGIIK
jgi:hypothetical protein